MELKDIAKVAAQASISMARLPTRLKNDALKAIARQLEADQETIFKANAEDIARAEKDGLPSPLVKRLRFGPDKLKETLAGLESLVSLPEPVGEVLEARELDRGLTVKRVSCPIGVVGIVFESRPDALVQISSLCLKSSNAVLLKGGREALLSNRALFASIDAAARGAGLPAGWASLLESREDVAAMLALDDSIDLIIPRGSNEFVRHIMDNTRIPVMGHADGVCHVYVDGEADPDMALRIAVDSKTQYAAVCNAAETLLVDGEIAATFLPALRAAMPDVELRGCPRTGAIIDCAAATAADWDAEYLDYILAVRVVDGVGGAVAHINEHGSGHTDAIVTADPARAERFMAEVDSADVFWNASTRFADGFKYGLGAEVGISTSKLHARGPVGLKGLLSYKWKLYGSGQVVADYAEGRASFKFKELM